MKTEKADREKAEARHAAETVAKRAARRGTEVVIRGIPVSSGVAIGAVFDTSEPPAEAPRRSIVAETVEAEKQRLLVKKSDFAQTKLLFIVEALKDLLADEGFTTLLRAEGLATMPRALSARISGAAAQ